MTTLPPTVITIEGHSYDVSGYISQHPGEGIRDVYLRSFNGKDKSEDFNYYHMTNDPWEILEKARELGEYKGIKFLEK